MAVPQPSPLVGVKLASLAVHVQEMLSRRGHPYDAMAMLGLLADPEVQAYLDELWPLGLLPVPR